MLINTLHAKCPECNEFQMFIRVLHERTDIAKIAHIKNFCCKCNQELDSNHVIWDEFKGADGKGGI